MLQFNYADQIG